MKKVQDCFLVIGFIVFIIIMIIMIVFVDDYNNWDKFIGEIKLGLEIAFGIQLMCFIFAYAFSFYKTQDEIADYKRNKQILVLALGTLFMFLFILLIKYTGPLTMKLFSIIFLLFENIEKLFSKIVNF